jgi:hypothetical protein
MLLTAAGYDASTAKHGFDVLFAKQKADPSFQHDVEIQVMKSAFSSRQTSKLLIKLTLLGKRMANLFAWPPRAPFNRA